MFIRFASGIIDAHSHVATGLFHSTYKLIEEYGLPAYEIDRLRDLLGWFNLNLSSPSEFRLRKPSRRPSAICWFKASAREHLAKAREMVAVLEDNGLYIHTIRSPKIGYKLYEDEVQVFAKPFADMRPGVRLRLSQ